MHIRRGTDDSGLTLDDDFPACLSLRVGLAARNSPQRQSGDQISALTPLSGCSQAAPKSISGRSRGVGVARWISELCEVDVLDMALLDIWLDLGLRSCGVSPVPQYPSTHARLVYSVDAAIIRQHVIRVYRRENICEVC
jgi:hypothetical protein